MASATKEIVKVDAAPAAHLSVEAVIAQAALIQSVMRAVMKNGHHYGTIPGCGDKPVLLKPGAEKLSLTFRLAPSFEIARLDLDSGHREYGIVCTLVHAPTGQVVGQGLGCCSTLETKYRYRNAADYEILDESIPKDAKEKRQEYRRKGFGMKKVEDSWVWVRYTTTSRVENPDIADVYNTVLKMGKKRALVDAILTATAASDIFQQDLEELEDLEEAAEEKAAKKEKPAARTLDDVSKGREPFGEQEPKTKEPTKDRPATTETSDKMRSAYARLEEAVLMDPAYATAATPVDAVLRCVSAHAPTYDLGSAFRAARSNSMSEIRALEALRVMEATLQALKEEGK